MRFPAFFIVGTGRSGTTLLRTMLTGHPAIEIPAETGFLPRLIQMRRLWWSQRGLRQDVFLRLVFANGRLTRAGLDQDAVARCLEEAPCSCYQDAISRVYSAFVTSSATVAVGDKTPGYVNHLPLLTRTFPDSRVVQVVRHPLDVVASLRRQPWGPDDVRAAAMMWRLDQLAAERAGLDDARLRVVRLEDLVHRPEVELAGVAEHLGFALHPDMLTYQDRAEDVIEQNLHPGSHAGLREQLRVTGKWDCELTAADAAAAWAVVGPQAEALGYAGPSAGTSSVALKNSASARSRLAAFHAGRSWRRLRTVKRTLWS